MKNACKHLALCTLTLILCLALAACGSDNSGDSADYGNDSTVPSTIDGFVKESYDSYDYSAFEGYYLPDSGTDFDYLIIDTNGSRWRIGNNDDLAASGYLQYDADYDCIYACQGQLLANVKRHPTIRDNVTIYSNSSVLGGETVIGENTIIGGNTFITESIPANTKVSAKSPELVIKKPKSAVEATNVWDWEN